MEIFCQQVGLFGTVVIPCQSGANVRYNTDIPLKHRTVCIKRFCVSWWECSKLRIYSINSWDYLDRRKYSAKPVGLFRMLEIFCQANGNIRNTTDVLWAG